MAIRPKRTEKIIREAEPRPGRDHQIFDDRVRGFSICIDLDPPPERSLTLM